MTTILEEFCELQQLRDFYASVLARRKSIRHLGSMGLEYTPGNDPNPKAWLPPLIKYLGRKIAGDPSQPEHC